MKLKAKILTIVLALAMLFSIVAVFAIPSSAETSNWKIRGDFNSWGETGPTTTSGNYAIYEVSLVANGSYGFKIFCNNVWYGNGGTINDTTGNDWWKFDSNVDCTLKTTVAGTYVFVIDTSTTSVAVYSPKTKVVGASGLCGSNWDTTDSNNAMSFVNGVFTKTYTNVPQGTYEYKVSLVNDWSSSFGDEGGVDNASVTVGSDNCTVTIKFDVTTRKPSAVVVNTHADSATDGDHNCDACDKKNVTTCSGGSATCIAKKVCDDCKAEYGDYAAHSWSTTEWSHDVDGHWRACTVDGCTAISKDGSDEGLNQKAEHTWNGNSCACGESKPACEHTYSTSYVWVADYSSCTATKTCTKACGMDPIEETTTDISVVNTATCTAGGTKTYTATFSAEHSIAEDTEEVTSEALGHSFGATTEANAATCLAVGNNAYKYCSQCKLYYAGAAADNESTDNGKSDTTSFVIPKNAHTLNSNYECSECENRIVYVKNTSWANVNCYTWPNGGGGIVGWPGAAMTDEGDDLWSYLIPISENCTKVIFNNGTEQTADLDLPTSCEVVYNKSASKWETAGHIFDLEVMNQSTLKAEATCNSYAVYYKSCSCGEVSNSDEYTFEYSEGGYSTNHVAPVETACGSDYICTICSGSIKGTHANVVTDAAVEPTCTETGLTEGSHCAACDTVLVSQEVVDASGHTKGADATCTTNQICTVCEVELKAALGHNFVNGDCDRCDSIKVFFKPGSDWAADNAWFAVYHFNVGNAWEKMTLENGVYTAIVPEGDTIIFCRMNPDYDVLGWDDGDDDRVWNQTVDILSGSNCFIIDNPWDSTQEYKATIKADIHEVTTWSPVDENTHSGECTVCGKTVSGNHEDSTTDNDHVCDYGCGATLGNHVFNGNGVCDCGSEAVASIGENYYGTLQDAFYAVKNDDTIVLVRNFELSATAVATASKFTIDLNGKTVSVADDYNIDTYNQSLICVSRGTNLTINDSVGGGTLDATEIYVAINLTRYGDKEDGDCATLTVNAGKYVGGWYSIIGNGSRDNTKFTINGGEFIGIEYDGIYHPQQGVLEINGGHIEGNYCGIYVRASHVIINGGTIIGKSNGALGVENMGDNDEGYGPVKVTVTGGEFKTESDSYDVAYTCISKKAPEGTKLFVGFISGGTFNTDFDLALLADGYALKKDDDKYVVVNAVAKIESTGYGYSSIADAVAAAQADDVITLLTDDTITNTLDIGKSLTINTSDSAITSKADVAFNITAAGVSFNLNGKVIVADPEMVANARNGGASVAQTVLTMDDVADVTAILNAEFALGDGDVIYSGPVDNISLSVRKDYEATLNKKGYVTRDSSTYDNMVDVIDKSLYYIGDDGYWYFDDVKTDILAKGENGESITITSYSDKQPVYSDNGNIISYNYDIMFSDGTEVTINVPVARSIVTVEYNRTNDNKDIYVITYSDGSTSEFTVTNGTDGHSPEITIDENGNWCIDGKSTGIKALGKDGKGIKAINKTSEGLVDTYTITYTDDTEFVFKVTNGRGIDSIDLTSTSEDGLVVTYTITYNDDSTSTFTVTNGANGVQGIQGEKGEDGKSPVITIQNGNWFINGKDTGLQAQGVQGETGNGISDISKTKTEGLVDTYTITFTDGSKSTFTVTNGAQGEQGIQGIQGIPGEDGRNPKVEIGYNGNWLVDGIDTGVKAEAVKGDTGAPGEDGEDGDTPYIGENGNWWIGDTDTGVKAEGKDGNDNNKIIIICIGIAALCIITTIVAVATKKFRRPWWILC